MIYDQHDSTSEKCRLIEWKKLDQLVALKRILDDDKGSLEADGSDDEMYADRESNLEHEQIQNKYKQKKNFWPQLKMIVAWNLRAREADSCEILISKRSFYETI